MSQTGTKYGRSRPRVSLNPKSIERSQRLDSFLQDKDDQIIASRSRETEAEMASVDDKEEELETFMDSMTDKAMVEDAKEAWEKKI